MLCVRVCMAYKIHSQCISDENDFLCNFFRNFLTDMSRTIETKIIFHRKSERRTINFSRLFFPRQLEFFNCTSRKLWTAIAHAMLSIFNTREREGDIGVSRMTGGRISVAKFFYRTRAGWQVNWFVIGSRYRPWLKVGFYGRLSAVRSRTACSSCSGPGLFSSRRRALAALLR